MRGHRQGCAARAVELGENSVVLWRPLQRQCDAPRNFRRRFGRRLGDMQLPIKSRQREGKTADGSFLFLAQMSASALTPLQFPSVPL